MTGTKRGGITAERSKYYEFIKTHGLLSSVAKELGRPMTRCKTADLRNFVNRQAPVIKIHPPKRPLAGNRHVVLKVIVEKAKAVAGKALSKHD